MNIRRFARYYIKAVELWWIIANGYGWKASFNSGAPVDGAGDPLPWYTYSAMEFLRNHDFSKARIFEFGCGNSSRFWARRALEVHSVENDKQWAASMRALGIDNLQIHEADNEPDYIGTPVRLQGQFDVVIIDGRFRRRCVTSACAVVSQDGLIVFDNADWYPDACADLRSLGWQQIDFSGPGPINPYCWTTAVFLRPSTRLLRHTECRPIGGRDI